MIPLFDAVVRKRHEELWLYRLSVEGNLAPYRSATFAAYPALLCKVELPNHPSLVDRQRHISVRSDPHPVLVRPIAAPLPLRPRRKEFRVARHVEITLTILEPPPVRTLIPE